MKKKIGILLRNDETYHLNKELVEWIEEYGMIPLGIPNNSIDDMIEITKICDGIILQGGLDYNEDEIKLVKYLYKENIPTFGICLGMQMMSVAIDGFLEKLPDLNHKSNDNYVHIINIKENTRLHDAVNCENIYVNSRHMDYVKYTGLDVSAMSSDLIIEAVEDKEHRFFVGVQWHPESLKDTYSIKLLEAFRNSL